MKTELTNIFNWARFALYLLVYGLYKFLLYLGYDELYSFASLLVIGMIICIPLEKCHRISNIKKRDT